MAFIVIARVLFALTLDAFTFIALNPHSPLEWFFTISIIAVQTSLIFLDTLCAIEQRDKYDD